MTTSAKLGLELLQNNAANQTLANTTFAILDQLCQAGVVDKDLSTPPGSPANGSLYIVASSPTGAWTGKAGHLAFWLTTVGAWTFIVPREGFLVHVNDEDTFYKYDGTAWGVFSGGGGGISGIDVEDEGVAQGTATTLNFTGSGVSVSVDTSGVATVTIPGGGASSITTQTASSSSGALDLSSTTSPVILVTLTENITSVTMPSGVTGESIERRIVFTQGGAGTYTIPTSTSAWGSIQVDGGGAIPQVLTGVGAVGVYVLANDDNTVWRMYTDQTAAGGGVTSVGLSAPTGFDVSGSPVTTTGTIALSFSTGYSLPTTAKQGQWDDAYGWGDHAAAGYEKELTAGTGITIDRTDPDAPVISATGGGGSGTVTSVALSVPTGFSVSGSPITTSGTLALSFDTGYSLPTTTKQGNWDTAYGWGDHASAGYEKELTAGTNITIDRTDPDNPVISAIGGGSGMTNPMTTAGDIIVGGTSGSPERLGIGTAGQILTVAGGIPSWSSVSSVLSKYFESAEQTITAAGLLTIAHGLGVKPKLLSGSFICKTAEAGYSVGDEFHDALTFSYADAAALVTNTASADATSIYLAYTSTLRIRNKSTGDFVSITPANWRYIVRAWA